MLDEKMIAGTKRAFKAYDVRGRIPDELNAHIVQKIGNAFVQYLSSDKSLDKPIYVGYDVRPTSEDFVKALSQGITDAGVDVVNIGLVGTDMVYFATAKYEGSGGIMITASHNPSDYNGLKFVREKAIPISGDSGLEDIKKLTIDQNNYVEKKEKGTITQKNIKSQYIEHVLSFIDVDKINPFKVVMNAGNGCAGVVLSPLMNNVPQVESIEQYWEPDGSFPNGIPNPLLPERRKETTEMVKKNNADLGVAWDGDFDRCFFFDEKGNFVEGYYLVAIFGRYFAKKYSHAKIIHDPRLTWATVEEVKKEGGIPLANKAGHTFIKERMRKENAVYAGEMSAHHFFRDNYYADNGMIPMLLLLQILSEQDTTLSSLVKNMKDKYPVSGEINIEVNNPDTILHKVKQEYKSDAKEINEIDGISVEFKNWRFNLRPSNTEPVIRLNLETRGDRSLLEEKKEEVLTKVKEFDK